MLKIIKFIFVSFFLVFILLNNKVVAEAENEELRIILESIQKDIKILEKAVYSEQKNISQNNSFDQNSEDVLTRHLLKLSEI